MSAKPHTRSTTQPKARSRLRMPAVGMESEFNVWVDGKEVVPEKFWKSPLDFIDIALLPRQGRSSQIPTGGAVYFDRGVIEVVTPPIELAPSCSARVVRSLWEQIGFVRDQLTRWEETSGHEVRLRGYSSHYNVSFEIPPSRQTKKRNEQKLALLLAYILPPPLMLLGANRKSTGVGVRPRGDRIEITLDFTPEPSLMIVTAAAIIGIVREVIRWRSYDLSVLEGLPIPLIDHVVPGKHTTRKGWLTKDFHYPRNPFTTDADEAVWKCTDGEIRSLREIALDTCNYFRSSIDEHGDPFSTHLLFAILSGESRSLLDLLDRPLAYDHVGILCKWGAVLADRILEMTLAPPTRVDPERAIVREVLEVRSSLESEKLDPRKSGDGPSTTLTPPPRPPRTRPSGPARTRREKRLHGTRHENAYPDKTLTRSVYERVFIAIASRPTVMISGKEYEPVGMDGWYRALFRGPDGKIRSYTIDHLASQVDTL